LEHFKILAHSGSFWLIVAHYGSFWFIDIMAHYGSFWLIPCFSTAEPKLDKNVSITQVYNHASGKKCFNYYFSKSLF